MIVNNKILNIKRKEREVQDENTENKYRVKSIKEKIHYSQFQIKNEWKEL